jgi:hypothetical protein
MKTMKNRFRNIIRAVALGLVLFPYGQLSAEPWDFLYIRDFARRATRAKNPFQMVEREYRVEPLPVHWERVEEGFAFYVEYAGQRWYCTDGTITVPAEELPKTISKLELLMALNEMEKLPDFLAWLEASGLKPFFDQATILSTDHPLYESAVSSVQQALGLTDEEVQAVLARIAK